MTYVTAILLYVFGLNPSKGQQNQSQPDPRRRHKPKPTPYNPQDVGGCAGTEFGCCPDGVTASNVFGSNCYGSGPGPGPQPAPPHHHHHHGHHYPPGPSPSPSPSPGPSPVPPGPNPGPGQTNYSCTPMAAGRRPSCHKDPNGTYTSIADCEQDPNCPGPTPGPSPSPSPSPIPVGGCATTQFGCCDDGVTARANQYGNNCHSVMPTPHHSKKPKKLSAMIAATAAPTPAPTTAPTPAPTTALTPAPLCWTSANAQKGCMGGWQPNGDLCIDPAGSNKCSPYGLSGMATYNDDMLNTWVNQCGVSNPTGCQ
jgi:hypothetical protein